MIYGQNDAQGYIIINNMLTKLCQGMDPGSFGGGQGNLEKQERDALQERKINKFKLHDTILYIWILVNLTACMYIIYLQFNIGAGNIKILKEMNSCNELIF